MRGPTGHRGGGKPPGKVVAVHRRRVLGVGRSHGEAVQAALRAPDCPPRDEIAVVFVEGRTVDNWQ
jgi:hypothetical protein